MSQRALNRKLDELNKQKWRNREKFTRNIEELEKEMETAKKTLVRLKKAMRRNGTSQSVKRTMAEGGSSGGSRRSPESKGSPKVGSSAYKKKKQNACKLCCELK